MSGGVRARLTAAVATMLAIAAPRQAAACWSEAEMDAAKIRDLQSRLMVATLRCQAAGVDVTGAYNRFVVANRATLQGINGVLMTQFRADAGAEAQTRYDRYATSLANAYGGDATNRSICANTARLAGDGAAAAGHVARLVALHSRVGLPPPLPGTACTGRPRVVASPAVAPAVGLDWLELD
ncbi:MAG: hypothetical protein ACXWUR_09865 [Allosphingosinicella sp.]